MLSESDTFIVIGRKSSQDFTSNVQQCKPMAFLGPIGAIFRLTLFVGVGDGEGVVDLGRGVGVGGHLGHGVRLSGDFRQRDEVLFTRTNNEN